MNTPGLPSGWLTREKTAVGLKINSAKHCSTPFNHLPILGAHEDIDDGVDAGGEVDEQLGGDEEGVQVGVVQDLDNSDRQVAGQEAKEMVR